MHSDECFYSEAEKKARRKNNDYWDGSVASGVNLSLV